jgi:hypothetical protein
MPEERSPCFRCTRLQKDKSKCACTCEKLELYKARLPMFTLWRGEVNYYSIPGIERKLPHLVCD